MSLELILDYSYFISLYEDLDQGARTVSILERLNIGYYDYMTDSFCMRVSK